MDRDLFLKIFHEALSAIREERFFESERGYQGALLAELTVRLPEAGFDVNPIVEQEYQKRLAEHGIRIRPDLIIHVPFDRKQTSSRVDGNFVAIEIKLRASVAEAQEDFLSLTAMKEKLGYPLTIFLNLNSSTTHADLCPEGIAEQTVCFAVRLRDGEPEIVSESGSYTRAK